MKRTITRFAPSPTGYLHIGGLRTALFSYLWAKKHDGQFKLRIEDTDQKREVAGAREQLIQTLHTMGLNPDGAIVVQSERTNAGIYRKKAEELIKSGNAYHCFCSEERLKAIREQQAHDKQAPRYDGLCRDVSADEATRRITAGEPSVIRIKMPNSEINVTDGIHGTITFHQRDLQDAILLKTDGHPTYHLANVVDDHDMAVTDVIRGEEWLPSLPLHYALYDALGYDKPHFFHVPLILNTDRTKLSKRQGDVSVESYLAKGYLTAALINYIAFLGWNPGGERELFSLADLIREFDIHHINKAGAVFSIEKLNWYNSWYIKNILATQSTAIIEQTLAPFLPELQPDQRLALFTLFFERIATLAELPELAAPLLKKFEHYDPALLIFKKSDHDKTLRGLKEAEQHLKAYDGGWTRIALDLTLQELMRDRALTAGDLFWPVRVALSGSAASPSPAELMNYLGKEESLHRLHHAISVLK